MTADTILIQLHKEEGARWSFHLAKKVWYWEPRKKTGLAESEQAECGCACWVKRNVETTWKHRHLILWQHEGPYKKMDNSVYINLYGGQPVTRDQMTASPHFAVEFQLQSHGCSFWDKVEGDKTKTKIKKIE